MQTSMHLFACDIKGHETIAHACIQSLGQVLKFPTWQDVMSWIREQYDMPGQRVVREYMYSGSLGHCKCQGTV